MEPGEGDAAVPGAGRLPFGVAAGADEEDIAALDGNALRLLGGFEVLDGDRLVRLEVLDAALAGDIEQDAAGDDAVLADGDSVRAGAVRLDVGDGAAVVELAVP